jgi:hypothetical protein
LPLAVDVERGRDTHQIEPDESATSDVRIHLPSVTRDAAGISGLGTTLIRECFARRLVP